jgi:hypothetical protein
LSDNYACKHFTTKWKDSIGQNVKGNAGENQLYEALKLIAKIKGGQAVPLGEPDNESEIIARKNNYPDCYLRIGEFESLYEARNICYDRNANPKDPTQLFWRTDLERRGRWMGVKEITEGKLWNEQQYPIRRSPNARSDAPYQYVLIKGKPAKFYVSTIPSYTPAASIELQRFFGDNMVFTEHPILSPEMVQDAEDEGCRDETNGDLLVLLMDKIDRALQKRSEKKA